MLIESIQIPKEAKKIICESLKLYQKNLESNLKIEKEIFKTENSQSLNYLHFDLIGLIGIFKEENAEIEIRIKTETRETFVSRHNVDFPLWENVPF